MKKLSCILVALFGMMGCINQTQAQSASFSNIRLEHNVPTGDGRTMLQFHYTMTVNGALGHKVHAVMFVDTPQGVGHHFSDGKVMKVDHNSTLNCSWETTVTSGDWWVGIYTDVLNPKPGKNTYYTRLGAWDETTRQYIGWSDFIAYDMTGQTNIQNLANDSYIVRPDGSVYHFGDPVPITPINNSNSYIVNPDGSVYHWDDGVGDNSSNSRSNRQNSSSRVKCYTCNGTGRVADDVTKGKMSDYGVKKPRMGQCSECGKTVNLDVHYHKTCPTCNGKGYR